MSSSAQKNVVCPLPNPANAAPLPSHVPGSTRLDCVDVSHYEPRVDWKQAFAFGIRVAMSKFTDGVKYVDQTGAADRAESQAAGMKYSPYHFFRFGDDPIEQANFFTRTLAVINPGELPPCLDLEWDNSNGPGGRYADGKELDEEGAQSALKFLAQLEKSTGMVPIVYTSPGFFPGKASLETATLFGRYPLWVAHYNVSKPRVPSPWKYWTFWQYTDKKDVPGTGKVDASYFNGGMEDLVKLTRT